MRRFFLIGLALELGLGVLGLGMAALFGLDLGAIVAPAGGRGARVAVNAGIGLLAAIPLLVLFAVALRSEWAPLVRIRRMLERTILPQVSGMSLTRVAAIAASAGLGEELFFRGFLQSALAGALGTPGAVFVAAGLFGLVHWITPFYALWAGVIGVYIGALYALTGGLLAPVVCHAVYDLVALGFYARRETGGAGAARLHDGIGRDDTVDEDASHRRAGKAGHLATGVDGGTSDVGQKDDV